MTNKFRNKYRIPSARFLNWDYRWAGAYFITICTQAREHYFGTIVDGVMQLSGIGILADVFLYDIKNHTENVEMVEYVVMPNHVHLILILNDEILHHNCDADVGLVSGVDDGLTVDGLTVDFVETLHATSLQNQQQNQQQQPSNQQPKNKTMSKISPKSGAVSTIIRSYKSAVTKHAHRLGYIFEWQERFHDHIIRDDGEYQRILEYIRNNPQNWKSDKFSQ